MYEMASRRIHSEGGVTERYCVLCREEEGKPNETAHEMVTIRPKIGGKQRRVAVCLVHVASLGKAASPHEVIAEPIRGNRPKGYAQPVEHVQGKSEKGNINRTLRRVERYGRTQRGRLGE
jgi:hypothetical protein